MNAMIPRPEPGRGITRNTCDEAAPPRGSPPWGFRGLGPRNKHQSVVLTVRAFREQTALTHLRIVGCLGGQQAGVDLTHGDAERLLLRGGLDQGTDVLEEALTELAVVGVDLAGALGREDHQRVLQRGLVEQLVDRRVGDAFGVGYGSHCLKILNVLELVRASETMNRAILPARPPRARRSR